MLLVEDRDNLHKFLNDRKIEAKIHYPRALHLQKACMRLGYKKGDFPISEELAEQGLSLPIYPELTNEQIELVSEKIHEFFK